MTNLRADLAQLLKADGLKVVEIKGWQTRGRPASKGPFNPHGILWHHTGDSAGGTAYAQWLATTGRPDLPAPLCHLSIGRDGTVYVIAAGRANHAGKAKASGPMPAGDGNSMYVGIECQNSGTEGWSAAQRGAMVKVAVLLGALIGCGPDANRGHKETSLEGKWDPGNFDMDKFRASIAAAVKAPPEAKPVPKPAAKVTPVREGRAIARKAIADLQRAAAVVSQAPDTRTAAHEMAHGFEAAAAAARDAYRKGPAK